MGSMRVAKLWSEEQLSRDDFLGGALKILQPRKGYRAGVDPVLLASSIQARAGDTVLELGCGAGVASLCLGRRVTGVKLTGLEIQPTYAALARRNAVENKLEMDVVTGDLANMPSELRQRQFMHVMANPPYFNRLNGTEATDPGRETGLGEKIPLAEWVKVAAKRTAPKGTVTFIHRNERLPELISEAMQHLGSLEVLPLIPRRTRAARLVLLRGRKGGRADFRLYDGWILHEGDAHEGDKESYTKATACLLRNGSSLSIFN